MPDRDLTAQLEEACRAAPPEVVAVYLFGSVARGADARHSDVDVAVLLREPATMASSRASASHIVSDQRLGEPDTNGSSSISSCGAGGCRPRRRKP
jgi:predicted nucleotidyltransferase